MDAKKIIAVVAFANETQLMTRDEYRNFMTVAVGHNLDVVTFCSVRVATPESLPYAISQAQQGIKALLGL